MSDTVYRQFEADLDMVAYQRVNDFHDKGGFDNDVEALINVLTKNPREIRPFLLLLYSLGYNAGMRDSHESGRR